MLLMPGTAPTPDGSAGPVSLWDLYRFAYGTALRSCSWRHRRQTLRLLVEPYTYWRTVEVPTALNHLAVRPAEKVLDIGSPKLASLFLWARIKAEVYATDLFPYFVQDYEHLKRCLKKPGPEYHIEIQDARSLPYDDGTFDKVYAISVIQHIENQGDSQAIREIARVLKPGGLCCITVPTSKEYGEDLTELLLYYKDSGPGKPAFHQRRYDAEALRARLIAPSGLELRAIEYFGERRFAYERFYESLPSILRIPFSLGGPVFSKLFLYRLPESSAAEAKAALLLLRKAEENRRVSGTRAVATL